MRPRRVCRVVLFAGMVFSCGCASAPTGIPVRRLPDEVLHCPPADNPQETISGKVEQTGAMPVSKGVIQSSFDSNATQACGVFYTGGGLGTGEYPLRRDLRVTEAIALVQGPVDPSHLRLSANTVTICRRIAGRQIPIRVDLNEALRDPRENIPIWPGDLLLTSKTCSQSAHRIFARMLQARGNVKSPPDDVQSHEGHIFARILQAGDNCNQSAYHIFERILEAGSNGNILGSR